MDYVESICDATRQNSNDVEATLQERLVPTGSKNQEQTIHHFTAYISSEQSWNNNDRNEQNDLLRKEGNTKHKVLWDIVVE